MNCSFVIGRKRNQSRNSNAYKYLNFYNSREELHKVSINAYESNNILGATLFSEPAIAESILIIETDKIRNFFRSYFLLYIISFFRSSKKDAISIRAKSI